MTEYNSQGSGAQGSQDCDASTVWVQNGNPVPLNSSRQTDSVNEAAPEHTPAINSKARNAIHGKAFIRWFENAKADHRWDGPLPPPQLVILVS